MKTKDVLLTDAERFVIPDPWWCHVQVRKVLQWGEEICTEHHKEVIIPQRRKHECHKCWAELKAELGKVVTP